MFSMFDHIEPVFLIAQIFGLIAVIFDVLSIASRKQKHINRNLTISNINYGIEYFLLGAHIAAITCIIAIIRGTVYSAYIKKRKQAPLWFVFLIIAVTVAAALLTKRNLELLDYLPIVSTILVTISTWRKRPKFYHIARFTVGFGWLAYNIRYLAFFSIIASIIEIVTSGFAITRFYVFKVKQGKPITKKHNKRQYARKRN
jgi:hypothetical protein